MFLYFDFGLRQLNYCITLSTVVAPSVFTPRDANILALNPCLSCPGLRKQKNQKVRTGMVTRTVEMTMVTRMAETAMVTRMAEMDMVTPMAVEMIMVILTAEMATVTLMAGVAMATRTVEVAMMATHMETSARTIEPRPYFRVILSIIKSR
eukprot:g78348.t1